MVTNVKRIWRHLNTGMRAVDRAFPQATRKAIEGAIKAAEAAGASDIRFAVEDSLGFAELRRGLTPRDRALQVFSQLRVWDTAHNSGVLIYVLLADRDVEIVADRGAGGGKVSTAEWEACCREMETHFGKGDFREGAIKGIEAVAAVLARHPRAAGENELPDAPAIL